MAGNKTTLAGFIRRAAARAAEFALKRKKTAAAAAIAVVLAVIFLVLDTVFPLPLYRLERDYSVLHLTQHDELLRISISRSGKYRLKIPLSEISPYIRKGVLFYEDRLFYFHPGINPYAVLRAAVLNIKKRRIVSGGSTITMQLARLMEPRKRNFGSKIIEAFRALQLEKKYSKDMILELYLNTVPMGGNIEGIASASYIYFNKPPSQLTAGEAALLIALPKSPENIRPDRNPESAALARNRVLSRVGKALGMDAKMTQGAMAEKITGFKFRNPYRLPHLVNRVFARDSFVRRYHIEMGLQEKIDYLLRSKMRHLEKYGVYNAAVIAVRNSDMSVIAYSGSPDFSDKQHAGEIDGVNIQRSPGSVLKPLLYALAVEKGFITPKSAVFDIERDYNGYKPANFEEKYHGPITAQDALTRSLNIPAVHLEYTLGKEGLYGLIDKAGFMNLYRKRLNPGLSVVLGALPLTLEEIVVLYAGLAGGGVIRPLNYIVGHEKYKGQLRVFSPETAYILSEMLSSGERPDLPQSWEFTSYRGKVAFKTGTSFGLRDAWCVGYNPDYTIGAWFGNADASASFELVGIKTAAPFVIEIFNLLTRTGDSWFKKPEGVKSREICAVSGMPPGEYCMNKTQDMYFQGRSSSAKCSVHKLIYIRKDNGKRADPGKIKPGDSGYLAKIVEDWPPEVASFLRRRGGHVSVIPPYDERERPAGSASGPKILKPSDGSVFKLTRAINRETQRIAFSAATSGGNDEVFWFINGEVTATVKADDQFSVFLEPGEWKISVQDSAGESDSVRIRVEENK